MPPPPTASLSVVINRSEARSMGSSVSKFPTAPRIKPRTYDDKPLPIQASDYAPRDAKIVSRTFEGGKVAFELMIGQTLLSDIGLEEVLEYVSPYHLEEYENDEFKKEEELLRIAEEEDRRMKEEERLRRKERAKTKGVVIMQESSDEDSTSLDVVTGKHGRARPSYKPLFKIPEQKRRRRRRRDPRTGELIPLSDGSDESAPENSASSDDTESRLSLDNMGLPKRRRRRKRDPVTGELMPLDSKLPSSKHMPRFDGIQESIASDRADSDQPKKRPRRRRHPITKELMPLGWRYEQEQQKESQIPAMQRLSLTKESEPKRRRLEGSESPWRRTASPPRMLSSTSHTTSQREEVGAATLSAFQKGGIVSLHDSDSERSAEGEVGMAPVGPKPKLIRRSYGGAPIVEIPAQPKVNGLSQGLSHGLQLPVRASPSKSSTSRPSYSRPSQLKDEDSSSEAQNPKSSPVAPATSIVQPSAADFDSQTYDSESEDDDLPDDEFVIEAILAHSWSNPVTHPSHMGQKPVMLYKVKWEGWTDPTWEPKTSFGDLSVIREYQKSVGMDADLVDD